MKQLKQLATTLKQLGIKVDPRVWIVLGIVVPLLIAVVGALWLRRKKKKAAEAEATEAVESAAARPAPPPDPGQLWSVWKRFLAELPRIYRRSILRFQPFVVLGAAGAGKSQVVETYTDWRRQQLQFLGSSLEDPNLQVYLGSHALVFELPAPLMLDTSSHARRRLLRLFKPLFGKRRPTAVVVVDLARLSASAPDAVRSQADLIRGKLNLLAEAHRAPVDLRVVLTRVDQLTGFEDFARFLEAQGLPAVIRLEPGAEQEYAVEGALQESFAQFDRLLPLALTTVPAESYLRIISFLREFPTRLSALKAYLPALVATDALGRKPNLERIYLASPQPVTARAANPFHPIPEDADALPTPLRMHRMIAGVVALLGVAFLGGSYLHERTLWRPSQRAMFAYAAEKDPVREARLRQEVTAFRRHEQQDALLHIEPSFFHSGSERLDDELARAIRDRYLIGGLDRAIGSDFGPRKSLYYLALLYATRSNPLGKMVLSDSEGWSEATGLDRKLIEDYVQSARTPYDRKVSLEGLPKDLPRGPANDAQPWVLYFLRVQRAIAGGYVSPEELDELKAGAAQLLQAEAVVERFEAAPIILRELDAATGYGFEALYTPYLHDVRSRAIFGSSLPDVKAALQRIASAQLRQVVVPEVLLSDLCARLKIILDDHAQGPQPTYDLQFGDQRLSIKSAAWDALVRNSAARAEVIAFVRDGGLAQGDRSIFFANRDNDTAVVMNPGTNGQFLFTGKAALNARFTRATFDRSVRPVLLEFNDLFGKMTLGADERRLLEEFVYRQVEQYATEYADAIDGYYDAYGVKAQSPEAVELLVKQMLRPDSPFKDLLRVVATNTQLDVDPTKVHLFQPLVDALGKYAALDRVMADKGSGAQELDSYQAILQQLVTSLHPDAAPAAKGAAPAAAGAATAAAGSTPAAPPPSQLADLLSPTAKVGLAILQGEKGSYWQLVRDWLANVGIPSELSAPFLDPIDQLYAVSLRELHDAVKDAWQHQVLTALDGVANAFPFDPDAREDAKPEDIDALFDPKTGKFPDLRRRFLEPIAQHLPSGWTARVGAGRAVSTPAGMYEVLNNVDRLTAELWDGQGKPQPLHVRVAPVPFGASQSKRDVLTLVYLSSGASNLFNFNQQPAPKVVELDWTKAKRAQVGVELTNTLTGEKTYPPAIVSRESPWGLLHLLNEGTREGATWIWVFRYGKDNELVTAVSFVIQPDPWKLFTLMPQDTGKRRASRGP